MVGKRFTNSEFIEKAKETHGDKYDYSKTTYNNIKEKVLVICPIHGEFNVTAEKHLYRNTGCKKCSKISVGIKRTKSTDKFIEKAKKIHGDKYDYSKTVYKNAKEKVLIICPIHGEFWQLPTNHYRYECSVCGDEKIKNKKMSDISNFIEKAKKVHGDKYDYSKSIYKGVKEKINITCSIHGEFWQLPTNHMKGFGCLYCFKENNKIRSNNKMLASKITFVERAEKVHTNKYDYSKTIYKGEKEKVLIICSNHGEFWQKVGNHLQGQGCPKCRTSIGENRIIKLLTEKNIEYIYQHKFEDCKSIRLLPFDFSIIKDKKIVGIIEFDGPQHYIQGTGHYSFYKLEDIQKRDEIKNVFCKNNNIPLLRVKDKENLEEEISPFLFQILYKGKEK